MKKQTLLTILLAAFGAANAATSMPNSELIGVASFNDQNSAKDVCLANNIVDERCESGNHKAVITVSKYNLKGTFGAIVLIKSDNSILERMNFKNLTEGKQMPFVKIKLSATAGKPAELIEVVNSGCFWSIYPSSANPSGGAVCEKLGFDYHSNSGLAVLLKNPNGGQNGKATH